MRTYAVDWANDSENKAVFNGKKVYRKLPPPADDIQIVTENMPMKYAKVYLEAGVKVYRCNTDLTSKVRQAEGIEKTHDNDAIILYRLFKESPEKFREFKIHPIFTRFNALYATFKEVQHLRISTSNRLYANGDEQVKGILKGLEKQESDILKVLLKSLKEMPIYTEFLSGVKGIGPATSSGLLAYIGDIDRFPSVSHMMSYFGLHVVDGEAPRKKKGQCANWHQKGRSLILGVIADSFVKQRTPIYRDIYEKEKAKQVPLCERLIVAEKRARRKAAKEFMKDFYREYKRLGCGLTPVGNFNLDACPSRELVAV